MPDNQSSYDPRKAVWNNVNIEDWDASKWKQWKPKHTGSPTDCTATIEREYLRIKYGVKQANSELDVDKCRIKLKLTSPNAIALQGTFPCKPGDVGKNGSPNKQYIISFGMPANDGGIKTAKAKARELDWQLTTKTFQWTAELLGKQSQKIVVEQDKPARLIGELIQEYEKEFWKTHEKNRQGIGTWNDAYWKHLKRLPQDVPLSEDVLIQSLDKTKPSSRTRFYLVWQLKKFCNFCGFDANKVINSYGATKFKVTPRDIPLDAKVIEGFNQLGTPLPLNASKKAIPPEQWQWAYGMIATYGLRPHELFAIDLDAYTSPTNKYNLITLDPRITDGTKTGERKCGLPPLHPEWVELFELKNIRFLQLTGGLRSRVGRIAIKFKASGIEFNPYDLRHAYAIRGHRLRIPIKTMADYMGHTVEEHTTTYQRWMSKDTNLEIYKEVVIEKQTATKEEMKSRIAELEIEISSLKAENESLKMLLTEYKLDDLLNR